MPIGGLLVTANGLPIAGDTKAELSHLLKERPIKLQIVPRDAAYLYRPRGIYHAGAASPR